MQNIAKGSRMPENQSESVRKPQNCCTKSDLPGTSLDPRPEGSQRPRNCADASSGRTHALSDKIDAKSTARTPEVISITPDKIKSPNSPIGPENWSIGGADGPGNSADVSSTRVGMQNVVMNLKTATSARKNVKIHQLKLKTRNLPPRLETETVKRPGRWNHISDNKNDISISRNAPIEAQGMQSCKIAFG